MAKEETKKVTTAPTLDDVAFGVAQQDGKWHIVELRYDLKSGNAKVFGAQVEDNRDMAIERFKIRVSQSGLLG